MPAFSTHYIFAKEAMPKIIDIADFPICREAVYLGSQGADIFFFHRALPWTFGKSLRNVGSAVHRSRPDKLFEAMREYCKSSGSPVAKSYTYGFLLHYALDRKCHPYVYSLQKKLVDEGKFINPHTAHNAIEYGLDAYILSKRYYVKKPVDFNTANTMSDNADMLDEISRLIENVIPKITEACVSFSQARQALVDTKAVQSALLDKTGIKRGILTTLEHISDKVTNGYKLSVMLRPRTLEKAEKYANIDKELWQSPYDDLVRNESFDELFNDALYEAVEMIKGFQAGNDCYDITKNISFLTGVEVK